MNFIFKIDEYYEDTEQIVVKFCRQNAPKPIDEYPSVAINCSNIDFTNYETFVSSIMKYGVGRIFTQESEEPTLNENRSSKVKEVPDIKKQLNKIISLNMSEISIYKSKMNKITLR